MKCLLSEATVSSLGQSCGEVGKERSVGSKGAGKDMSTAHEGGACVKTPRAEMPVVYESAADGMPGKAESSWRRHLPSPRSPTFWALSSPPRLQRLTEPRILSKIRNRSTGLKCFGM